MPKTIFHTTEKSNFILNMDLDRYRSVCGKLLFIMLTVIAGSSAIHQITYSLSSDLSDMMQQSGFSYLLASLLISLRSISMLFSICGVAAIIAMVVGLMRNQFSKATALPYGLVLAVLAWGIVSLINSFDSEMSFFGLDGRDEGWLALLMYAAMFYLGSMLRRKENLDRFFCLIMGLGIANAIWGMLQAQPWFSFPNQFAFVEPLLYQNLRLPSGFTDSPITFAMLLGMLLGIAIPYAMLSESKKKRIAALVSMGLSMLLLLKTQTVAGLIAAVVAVLEMAVLFCIKHNAITGKRWLAPVVLAGSLLCSFGWAYVSPGLNDVYQTYDNASVANGYRLYDGGIVWDDGSYRLSTSGPYSPSAEPDFDIYNAASVLGHCWQEGLRVVGNYPMLGTGPDNFTYSQLKSSMYIEYHPNAIDRPYNEYIYIAATRGIPSLLLYLAFLAVCIWYGIRNYRKTKNWLYLASLGGAASFTLTAVVGISVLTVSPLMWILLGILIGEPIVDTPKAAMEQSKQKSVKNGTAKQKKAKRK